MQKLEQLPTRHTFIIFCWLLRKCNQQEKKLKILKCYHSSLTTEPSLEKKPIIRCISVIIPSVYQFTPLSVLYGLLTRKQNDLESSKRMWRWLVLPTTTNSSEMKRSVVKATHSLYTKFVIQKRKWQKFRICEYIFKRTHTTSDAILRWKVKVHRNWRAVIHPLASHKIKHFLWYSYHLCHSESFFLPNVLQNVKDPQKVWLVI